MSGSTKGFKEYMCNQLSVIARKAMGGLTGVVPLRTTCRLYAYFKPLPFPGDLVEGYKELMKR